MSRIRFKAVYRIEGEYHFSPDPKDTESSIDTLHHILQVRMNDNGDNNERYEISRHSISERSRYGKLLTVYGFIDTDQAIKTKDDIQQFLEYYLDPYDFGEPYNGEYLKLLKITT